VFRRLSWLALAALAVAACGDDAPQLSFVAVTFNTGTTAGLPHDDHKPHVCTIEGDLP